MHLVLRIFTDDGLCGTLSFTVSFSNESYSCALVGFSILPRTHQHAEWGRLVKLPTLWSEEDRSTLWATAPPAWLLKHLSHWSLWHLCRHAATQTVAPLQQVDTLHNTKTVMWPVNEIVNKMREDVLYGSRRDRRWGVYSVEHCSTWSYMTVYPSLPQGQAQQLEEWPAKQHEGRCIHSVNIRPCQWDLLKGVSSRNTTSLKTEHYIKLHYISFSWRDNKWIQPWGTNPEQQESRKYKRAALSSH